jgi:general secretion pathway protein G
MMKSRQGKNKESGFTLIELMVVIFILGLLAAVAVPRFMGESDKAKQQTARTQIELLGSALKMYKLDNGSYPTTEQGLKALVEPPAVGNLPKNWRKGGYLEKSKVPKDPWKNEFIYVCPGSHGDFDITSLGADGEAGGEGFDRDINSWDTE